MSCFMFMTDQQVAGCVERILVASPFLKPAVVNTPQGQRQMNVPDPKATWNWVSQQQLPFPPGANFKTYIISASYMKDITSPQVLMVQTAPPVLSESGVNSGSPYGPPVGNRGAPIGPPPIAGQPGGGGHYEDLPDAALPGNADPMVGDTDPAGGTFTDIDLQGNETRRDMMRPISPPPHLQGR